MCSAREKLREVGQELDCTYAELRDVRVKLARAIFEKETAEFQEQNIRHHNMRLTRTADFSNFAMCSSLMMSFVLCGLLVYIL